MLLRKTDVTRDWAGLLLSKRTSKKGSLWLTSVSMVNLVLGCFPFMYWKNSNASFSLLNTKKVDRTFKINNTWTGFHNNIKELSNILEKNQFPSRLVNSIVKQYLSKFFASTSRASAVTSPNETHTHYYKLPFIGPFSSIAQRRIRRLTQRFCKNLDIKLVFAPYKIKNLFRVKDAIPKTLRSRVVYKFSKKRYQFMENFRLSFGLPTPCYVAGQLFFSFFF